MARDASRPWQRETRCANESRERRRTESFGVNAPSAKSPGCECSAHGPDRIPACKGCPSLALAVGQPVWPPWAIQSQSGSDAFSMQGGCAVVTWGYF